MPTYQVTRKTDGAEVYRYNAPTPTEWQGFEFTDYDHVAQPDMPAAGAPAPEPVVWPLTEFLLRFTQAERILAKRRRATDSILDDIWMVLESSLEVHSVNAVLRQGMGYLVTIGVLSIERMHAILGDTQ